MLNKYSQNFLKSTALVADLIRTKSDISRSDTVLDIGAGKGVITKQLSRVAKQVIAYEVDNALARSISDMKLPNVEVIAKDFLNADISTFGKSLKVFSNIPFFITADIFRKLFVESSNIESAFIIMEKEAAWRFLGKPYKTNSLMSVLINSRYEAKIVWRFSPNDFIPRPNAEIVLVSFIRNGNIKTGFKEFCNFAAFVFNLRKNSLKNSLYNFWRYEKVKSILKKCGIGISAKVSDIKTDQWVAIFNEFVVLPPEKKLVVAGAFSHLMRHQQKLNRNKIIHYNG